MTSEVIDLSAILAREHQCRDAPHPVRSDHDAMLSIHEQLDGVEWSSDTLDRIASILEEAGYPVRDIDE